MVQGSEGVPVTSPWSAWLQVWFFLQNPAILQIYFLRGQAVGFGVQEGMP